MKMKKIIKLNTLVSCITIMLWPSSGIAQEIDAPPSETNDDIDGDENQDSDNQEREILVTAQRIRGSVISEVPPVDILSEDDIASYGADSIQELLGALSPQTGSSRGRASGPPIVLINAQRVSGFRELRNIPPEAIVRVEIFPEEIALQYGFRPDRRVINFILKDDFSSIDINGGAGASISGGYATTDIGSTFTKFSKKSRLNLDVDYETTSTLTEDERRIIQEENTLGAMIVGPIGAQDIGQFRTLLPSSDKIEIEAVYSRPLSKLSSLSINAGYTNNESISLLGLNNPVLIVPDANQFNNSGTNQLIQRFFVEPRPLQSTRQSDNFEVGLAFNTSFENWRWSTIFNANYTDSAAQTDQNNNFTALRQDLINDDSINIFADDFAPILGPSDIINTNIKTTNINNSNTLAGTLFNIANGEVRATFRGRYNYSRIDSDSDQSGVNVNTILSRNTLTFGANIDIPLIDRGVGIGRIIGSVSINGNASASDVSDFGSLTQYGFGIIWKPIDDLTITVTSINEDTPPSIAQLGNPISITPNVPIFDFSRSETSFILLTTGGNPNLLPERQRDIKISANFSPNKISGFNIIADYSRNRSFDTSNAFPLLTPEIEAAFPDRVTRDADGVLLALNRTAVLYDRVASERIRYGLNFSKTLGRGRGAGRPRGRPEGAARPKGAARRNGAGSNGARRPTGSPKSSGTSSSGASGTGTSNANGQASSPAAQQRRATPPRGRGAPSRRPGRFNISIFHTIALNESILIRPEVTELDLLNGSAIGSNGGAARHKVELEGGIFNKGIGVRASANYQSGSTVDGDILTRSSDLRFGSLATLDFRVFFNLNARPKLLKSLPFLKNSRLSINVDNVFNAIQNITNSSGNVPINFQRGFIDPRGRFVQMRFRKRF